MLNSSRSYVFYPSFYDQLLSLTTVTPSEVSRMWEAGRIGAFARRPLSHRLLLVRLQNPHASHVPRHELHKNTAVGSEPATKGKIVRVDEQRVP